MKDLKPTIPSTSRGARPVAETVCPAVAVGCRWEGADMILSVKVHPRGGTFKLGRSVGNWLQVKVASSPEDGKATDELLAGMARIFGVRPGAVTLIQGAFTPRKIIRICRPQKLPPEIVCPQRSG